MTRRVVVTGMGMVTPLGLDVASNWDALTHGRSGIARISRFDPAPYETQIAGEVKGFEATQYMDRKEVRRTDRFTHLGVAAASQALKDAGLETVRDPERVGTAIATGVGGLETLIREVLLMEERGPSRLSPFLVPMLMANAASAQVSMQFGLKGPSLTHVSACASSSHAIGECGEIIRRGQADVMVTGGAEAAVLPLAIGAFSTMHAMSRRNADPEHASRPFDKDRDGFVLSEGGAVVVIEEREHAKQRGARIYGELVGYGATADAYHITSPSPEGEGNARAMRMALDEAGMKPAEIDYINAHGTSTQPNDREETSAIKQVFGEHAYKLMVSSTKSMSGHLLGAAGAFEAIACLLALREGCIPPTINYTTPDPQLDLDYVPNDARAKSIRTALSNSMGFGGHNASLIFVKA
ncbi:MAG: beta-ketoacyl-ACP synthase II [Chloroflexi bacterium]|nr:MAG: beta-ketoacyl-ACP synthase II [Chloroflexota bacterium]TMB98357.1 MAG: beta-ketoacyl-ACP synthase II [Chloroflexota bacterium]TMC28152.1 MAG: beta-ketoacyl-ACP synthase II [Chloroflexota bacterium]TMC34520.1 MAG: beta-ketoacyl-ACP synthase II [Chloroflexota bacterium]TME38032.1 MAG: beta-ketoacyl-ACP synthase II [Chloroflexota bacterium]